MSHLIEITAGVRRKGVAYPAGCQFQTEELSNKATTKAVDPWGNPVRLPTNLVRVVKQAAKAKPKTKTQPTLAALIAAGAITKGLL